MIRYLAFMVVALANTAKAEVPVVVTDIAPVQSLVSHVMGDLAQPKMLLPPGANPHDFALRPSDARALQDADIVFWVGPELTPWLEKPMATLAGGATSIIWTEHSAAELFETRKSAFLQDDDHDTHGHGGHDHEFDPHLWLDPVNGALWLDQIVEELSEIDPKHAEIYAANAAELRDGISASAVDLPDRFADMPPYAVLHDAYQYFENRAGLAPVLAIWQSDDSRPSVARMQAISAHLKQHPVGCLITDRPLDDGLIENVFADAPPRVIMAAPLSPPGPDGYLKHINALSDAFAQCLEPS